MDGVIFPNIEFTPTSLTIRHKRVVGFEAGTNKFDCNALIH